MAQSHAHRWGQIIGDVFELFVRDVLQDVAAKNSLYLDFKKPRKARASQSGSDLLKVTWQDGYGNKHDLDYVLERGGTEETIGTPVAFVESAWRRYTKHSKNKVQEIEAAVMPVALTFSRLQPFLGAVLAGEFTGNALNQLVSKGFAVLHVHYASIIEAFRKLGIDASSADGPRGTTEADFKLKISLWNKLDYGDAAQKLISTWHTLHKEDITTFKQALQASINRRVDRVTVTVLRGHTIDMSDVQSAIDYLIEEEHRFTLREGGSQKEHFDIQLRFNNGARVEASFPTRQEAISFLRNF